MKIRFAYFFVIVAIITIPFLPAVTVGAETVPQKNGYRLGGTCYADVNRNGGFDETDQRIGNATVVLNRLVSGFFLVPIDTQHTGSDGSYAFTHLKRGFYQIACRPSVATKALTENPATVLLGFFQPDRTVDFGFAPVSEDIPAVLVRVSAEPLHIIRGESTTLTWTSENADSVSIDNDIGPVAAADSLEVYPQDNATYTVTAEGFGMRASDSVIITVAVPLPPPSPSSTTTSSALSTTTTTISGGGGGGGGGNNPPSTTTSMAAEPPQPATNLIAAGSDNKIGLAWTNPADDGWEGTLISRDTDDYPAEPADGEIIYDGTGSDWVDYDVENNVTYFYTAFSYGSGYVFLQPSEDAAAAATPQDVASADWADWQHQPDPFADHVISYVPAMEPNAGDPFGYDEFPDIVLGPPSGGGELGGSMDVLSLGARTDDDNGASAPYGGSILLKFTDNIIVNGDGYDFTVFENAFTFNYGGRSGTFGEPALVSVSQDNATWYQFPCRFNPLDSADPDPLELIMHCSNPGNYPVGFAGINPVFSHNLEPDPTDPFVSGGDSFDLDDIVERQLRWVQYIKIQSTGDNATRDTSGNLIRHNPETGACSGANYSGFDLDAVSAIHY